MVAMLLVNRFIYHGSSKSSTGGQFVLSETCLVKVKAVFFHVAEYVCAKM